MPIVTEIMNTEHLPLFGDVDLIQVGARNMQNFRAAQGGGGKAAPVLLKARALGHAGRAGHER